ncbi:FAD-dependent monooxygenase [Pseudonocardia eucalypti]|uniref:FAD-dependent monooxygenase n=1 Tax=Pseudonocardia eucalypti TaxID=648755 RepID=A0ABP9PGR3_9PSEU|nr:2-polyprenyl-6-methoxyphenol hydroxylase-like FAD-dependent oxidoreductase [Pseudonocardia eucalypti]
MNIVCVGAGPAGLYFAICTKLRDPDAEITVLERSPEGVTFGWGFGFWDDVLDMLYANDPVTAKQVEEASGVWGGIEVHVGSGKPGYLGGYGLSMGRQRLLDILVARARDLGIKLEFEHPVESLDEFADADLIVAGDGINSGFRTAGAARFGTSVDMGTNHYLWLGAYKEFKAFRYIFERTPAGWIWLHCYYLDAGRSTVIVECPPSTWQGLGFDRLGPAECLQALEKIFARHLDGASLISQMQDVDTVSWLHGKQVRNARWYDGNVALLGDAAHSTHFSIGSGTRLAIGDSVALAAAVASHPGDIPAALATYDATRRPVIDQTQAEALASMRFLESAPARLDTDPDPVAFAYAISRRLGSRTARWRYYLHLATQVTALRTLRARLTAARRTHRRSH